MSTIKDWAEEDRPREKLLSKGVASLSDAELLTILIATGTKKYTAMELAQQILLLKNNQLSELGKLDVHELTKVNGIGQAKAITIVAALEIGRRRSIIDVIERENLSSSDTIAKLFRSKLGDLPYEEFWMVMLNNSLKLMDMVKIAQGGIGNMVVDIRLLMKPAIERLCSAIIVVHNHPSGTNQPSEYDRTLTNQISEAVQFFNIRLLDHVIVTDSSAYFSFADQGLL